MQRLRAPVDSGQTVPARTDELTPLDTAATPPPGDDHPGRTARLTAASWWYAARRSLKEFAYHGGADLAGMLTFYTILSIAPGLLVVFSISFLVLANNAETVTSVVSDLANRYVTADYRALVIDLVEAITDSASGGLFALVIGIGTALWFASGYVKAFSRCMNALYGRVEGRGTIHQNGTMLLTTLGLAVGVVMVLVAIALNDALVSGVLGPLAGPLGLTDTLDYLLDTVLPVWAVLRGPVVLVLVVLMVGVLYHVTPNVRRARFAWISAGSVVAILGIALVWAALSTYLARFARFSPYGTVGTGIAFLVALWLFNIMLLLGAEVDAEIERARQLQEGMESEVTIQLPPRSTKQAKKVEQSRERLHAAGRDLRLSHSDTSADAQSGSSTPDADSASDHERRPGASPQAPEPPAPGSNTPAPR